MINIKKSFDKLFKSIEESSPNLKKTLREISPLTFFLNIKGHQDIYITINSENSYINFNENIYGETIRIYFHEYLRHEQKFETKEDLSRQLKLDKKNAEKGLQNA